MNVTIESKWQQLMSIPEARWVVWTTILAIIVLVAVFVVMRFRNMAIGKLELLEDPLSEFRRMRDEGALDDKEFASVRSTMLEKREKED
jgi:hypothetical protein